MCLNLKLEVTLPIIESFLMMFSLRTGCIVVITWTILRSFLTGFFFKVLIVEVLLKKQLPWGPITVHDTSIKTVSDNMIIPLYFFYLGMVLTESFLFLFCWYCVRGLCVIRPNYFVPYLICRLITWVSEVLHLSLLCVLHKLLIGWYLGILFFVILEFYACIVVYSYYCVLYDCQNPCKLEESGSGIC